MLLILILRLLHIYYRMMKLLSFTYPTWRISSLYAFSLMRLQELYSNPMFRSATAKVLLILRFGRDGVVFLVLRQRGVWGCARGDRQSTEMKSPLFFLPSFAMDAHLFLVFTFRNTNTSTSLVNHTYIPLRLFRRRINATPSNFKNGTILGAIASRPCDIRQ